jgi:hypothetical protein
MPQIYDMEQMALLPLRRRGGAENFFALKNPTASAGFEPANLGTKGQHATPRPPKPLTRTFTNKSNILMPFSLRVFVYNRHGREEQMQTKHSPENLGETD